MIRTYIIAVTLLFSLFALAGEKSEGTEIGLGFGVGIPVGLYVEAGVWQIANTPSFFRGRLGLLVLIPAVEMEAGYFFDLNGSFKQYLSLQGGTLIGSLLFDAMQSFHYVGPQYGFRAGEVFQLGIGTAYFIRTDKRRGGTDTKSFGWTLPIRIGAIWLF